MHILFAKMLKCFSLLIALVKYLHTPWRLQLFTTAFMIKNTFKGNEQTKTKPISIKITIKVLTFSTFFTNKRFIVGVYFLMPVKILYEPKFLRTNLALIRRFFGVGSHVEIQFILFMKCWFANGANMLLWFTCSGEFVVMVS